VLIFLLNAPWRRGILLVLIAVTSFSPFAHTRLHFTLLNHIQYFLAGFLLADLYLQYIAGRSKQSAVYDVAGFVIMFLIALVAQDKEVLATCLPFLGLAFFYAVFKSRLLNRVLTNKVLCIIGGMCYTIYLFHYPFICFITNRLMPLPIGDGYSLRILVHSLFIIPMLLVLCLMLYVLVERPCMDKRWPLKLYRWMTKQNAPDVKNA
jgi:peptidoglycan/LPS O-acetylase OafA/YrhL